MPHLAIGAVLWRSAVIWGRNIVPFSILVLLVQLPILAFTAYVWAGNGPSPTLQRTLEWSTTAWAFAIDPVAGGALAFGVIEHLRGRQAGFGAVVGVGLRHFLPTLGVAVFCGVVFAGGLMLLVVPGVIFVCALWVAVPCAVVERTGIMASLRRSLLLTRGQRLRIFGLLLSTLVLGTAIYLALELALEAETATLAERRLRLVLEAGLGILAMGYGATVAAVSYHDLRRLKEGADSDELARVFA